MVSYDNIRRVTVFAGHYGSGKTNLAINYALMLRKSLERVAIADLDIVNPYFRTEDSRTAIEEAGVRFISSRYANSNAELPSIPAESYAIIEDTSYHTVVDVGGDDRGALVLGRYAPKLLTQDYDMFLIVNKYRPLTRESNGTVEICKEIEVASGLTFTGIINNSNLGLETTVETVLASQAYAEEIALSTGLPLRLTAVREDLNDHLQGKIENLLPIKLYHSLGGRFFS